MPGDSASGTAIGKGVAFGLLAFGLFSTHDALIKGLGDTYSVFQIMFFSMIFAFLPVTVLMSSDGALDNFRPHKPVWLAMRSLATLISMMAAFYAFSTLRLTEVYAIVFITPLLITALSVPMLGETVRLRRWLAILLGLVGVIVVLRPGATELTFGHLAALVAALAGSLATIIVRKIGPEERSAVLMLYPMLANVIVIGAILPFVYTPMPFGDLAQMAAIGFLFMGGQLTIILAYKAASPVVVAPMQYTQILWATVYGFAFFDEFPDIWVGIGAAIIIASGVFAALRENTKGVSRVSPILRAPNVRPDTGPSLKRREEISPAAE